MKLEESIWNFSHDEVMIRGTFANIRLNNKLASKIGPKTLHIPSGKELDVYDAAALYKDSNQPVIILAGAEYGSGSSRDWAAKGPLLQGVRAVIAVSFERIHRSNLVGMGIIPMQFLDGKSADSLNLSGKERYTIVLGSEDVKPGQMIKVKVFLTLEVRENLPSALPRSPVLFIGRRWPFVRG